MNRVLPGCSRCARRLLAVLLKLAGDQGFEPCNAGFGVRRSPDRACPPWYARRDSNPDTRRPHVLSVLRNPFRHERKTLVPEEGFEPPRPKTVVPKTTVSAVPPLGHNLVSADGFEPPWPRRTVGLQPTRFSRSRTHSLLLIVKELRHSHVGVP